MMLVSEMCDFKENCINGCAVPKNGVLVCRCFEGYTGSLCELMPIIRPCNSVCSVYGDPHYKTLDLLPYNFQGSSCAYILSEHAGYADGTCKYRISSRNLPYYRVAYVKYAIVEYDGYRLEFNHQYLWINGVRQCGCVTLPGIMITKCYGSYSVQLLNCGVLVQYVYGYKLYVRYGGRSGPNNLGGRLTGLCGNCNGNYADDNPATASCLLGIDNQCVVPGSCVASVGRRKRQAPAEPFVLTEADKTKYGADNFCGLLNKADGPFGECIGANDTTITTTFDNCVFDAAAMRGNIEAICSSLTEAETACEEAGHTVTAWRTADLCRKINYVIYRL
ncbi:zonadhesin-like [Tubulanus polymorphus]|uniref:zonadhesin-like n=1 Tax=Tubulanus polymorphus TaxID=672921 RepID=UPI003DA50C63